GADTIHDKNWYGILLNENINYGRSNPDSDPCGYRTVITLKLAEQFYEVPGLANKILEKDQRYIRPKETDLLALLESHTIDYIFIYKSVAKQHELPYLTLPAEINLSDPAWSDFYRKGSVAVSGKSPGDSIIKYGEPMVYGVTIIKDAPNRPLAEEFVRFMLDEGKGMRIMRENGQGTIKPTQEDYNNINTYNP
ncbi:MAG: substrate-binding domain-containing protein, partial [Bacteroidetes bacterium]|nr:substrate-binding domain-containing protein [Bacteroidota bacterium]